MIKPILFNTDMVRALQANIKTATRRPVKPHYREGEAGFRVVTNKHTGQYVRIEIFDEWEDETRWLNEPYRPGDILWVRETWCLNNFGYHYRADWPGDNDPSMSADDKWRPSIHMPREAARIFLRVTDVRVERLQDITGDQAKAEGAHEVPWAFEVDDVDGKIKNGPMQTAIQNFAGIWDSTIKKADRAHYGWEANPWVWVIEFERVSREEALAHDA